MAPARVVENWVLSKFLGEGGFGKVWLGYHAKFYCMRVIKEIPLGGRGSDDVKNEVQALRTLNSNPNIVHMVDAFESNGSMFIVMEYCRGGDLWQFLNSRGSVDEDTCRYLLCQLAEGLKVLRQHNIVHRDLKPSNLLLSDDGPTPTLKIADFGIAAQVEPEGLPPSYCGTVPYSAPEMQRGPYGAETDLWSVGVIMYEMLTGVSPFQGDNYFDLMESVKKDKVKLPDSVAMKLTPGCRNLLHRLLKRNPANRISYDDFFSHPFFAGKEASAAMTGMCEEEEEEEEEGDMYTAYEEDISNQDFDFIYNGDEIELYAEYGDGGVETATFRDVASESGQLGAKEKAAATAVAALPGPSSFILPPPLRYLVMLRQEMLQNNGKTGEAPGAAGAAEPDTQDQQGPELCMGKWTAASGQQAAVQDEQAERGEELLNSEVDSILLHLQAKATGKEDHGGMKGSMAKMLEGAGLETGTAAASAASAASATLALRSDQSAGSNLPLPLRYLVKLRHEMLRKNVDGADTGGAGIDCAARMVGCNVQVAVRPSCSSALSSSSSPSSAAEEQQVGAAASAIHVVMAGKHSSKPEAGLPSATTAAAGAARVCHSIRLQHRLRGTIWPYCQQQVKPVEHGCAVMYAHGIPALIVQPVASRCRRAI